MDLGHWIENVQQKRSVKASGGIRPRTDRNVLDMIQPNMWQNISPAPSAVHPVCVIKILCLITCTFLRVNAHSCTCSRVNEDSYRLNHFVLIFILRKIGAGKLAMINVWFYVIPDKMCKNDMASLNYNHLYTHKWTEILV